MPANSSRATATCWDSVGADEATVLPLEDFDILRLRNLMAGRGANKEKNRSVGKDRIIQANL